MKKRKGIEAPRVKHPAPSRAIDALIGDEEQNGNQEIIKRNVWVHNPDVLRRTGIIR